MAYFISIMLTASVILSIVALGIVLQPEAKAQIMEPSLVVEDVYFVMTPGSDSTSSTKDVTMSAFITNKGMKDAANVEVRTFAVDSDTNLGVDYNQANLGLVPKDTTGEATLTLKVPEGNSYRIELLVFESGKIVVRGSGTVKLLGSSGTAGEDFQTDGGGSRGPDEKDEEKKSDGIFSQSSDDKGSSAAALLALVFVIIVIIVIGVIAGKNALENSNRTEITTIKRFDGNINGNGNGGGSRPAGSNSMGSTPTPVDKPAVNPIIYKQEV